MTEYNFPGGLTAPDGCRTDVILIKEDGGLWELKLVTGNGVFALVGIEPTDLRSLIYWVRGTTEDSQ